MVSDAIRMSDCLFVYGTLMRAAASSELGRDMRERLDREAEWLGTAEIRGELYDRGPYPLLVITGGAEEIVHGEVYRLRRPDDTFPWLDDYEGVPSESLIGDEYERRVEPVTLRDGSTIRAWVYVHRRAVRDLPRLMNGRWRPPSR